jgi:hypothetical protein
MKRGVIVAGKSRADHPRAQHLELADAAGDWFTNLGRYRTEERAHGAS